MINKLAFTLLAVSLWAQPPLDPPVKSRNNSVWVGSGDLLQIPASPESPKAPATLISTSGRERSLPLVPSTLKRQGSKLAQASTVHAPGGSLFGLTTFMVEPCDPSRAPRKDFKIEVYQFDQTKWMWTERPIGQLQSSAFFVPTVLSRDYLLGIAPSSTTFKGEDDRYYPFAIFKRDVKGTYLLDHYEDAGMGTPAIRSNGTWAYPFMASLWLQSNPIWIRDLSVIGSGEGLFWSFGPEGQFRGMAKIYEGLDDAFLRVSLPWNGALVDYQPNASGELVVSCLDSEAAVNGSALMAASKQAKDMDSAIEAKNRCLDRVLSKWHLVQWYKVQLPSGAKTRIPCPAGMPPIVANAQDYLSFNWAFQPNGIIKMNVR